MRLFDFNGRIILIPNESYDDFVRLIESIKTAPTVDAVPVIRCKDCKHWQKVSVIGHIHYLCTKFNKDTEAHGYCYLAEGEEE